MSSSLKHQDFINLIRAYSIIPAIWILILKTNDWMLFRLVG